MKYTKIADKPYGFVPLIKERKPETRKSHAQIEPNLFSGKMKLSIYTLTPVHIGSNFYNVDENEEYKSFLRSGKKVVIPGSSLKGLVRSIAEAVSYSCAPLFRPASLEWALHPNNKEHCKGEKLCPTCSVFGGMSYKGKVAFGDFILTGEGQMEKKEISLLQSPFENYPKCYEGNPRLYYCRACDEDCSSCAKEDFYKRIETLPIKKGVHDLEGKALFRGRKFYFTDMSKLNKENLDKKKVSYEFVKSKATFIGEIVFQNLTHHELQLLAYAMGLQNDFSPKIGYGKSLGYGAIRINLDQVEDYRTRYMDVKNPVTKEMIEMFSKEYKAHSIKENTEIKTAIEQLCSILSPTEGGEI